MKICQSFYCTHEPMACLVRSLHLPAGLGVANATTSFLELGANAELELLCPHTTFLSLDQHGLVPEYMYHSHCGPVVEVDCDELSELPDALLSHRDAGL